MARLLIRRISNSRELQCFTKDLQNQPQRTLFYWTVLAFNRVDTDRIKQVGADRACAEWLLRNGAAVKWKGESELFSDYNALPPEEQKVKQFIREVDATDSGIHHSGFSHFEGCEHIDNVKLVHCVYIDNEALPQLSILKDTLLHLEIRDCANLTQEALYTLKHLRNLKTLQLGGLPYVKNKAEVEDVLKKELPNCDITFN